MTPFLSLLSPSCFLYNLSLKPQILEHPLKDISFVRMTPRDNSFCSFYFYFLMGGKLLYKVLCCFMPCSNANHHSFTYITSLLSLPPQPQPTPLDHHRAPGWAPCVIQQLPTSYLFYTWWCIHVYATFSFTRDNFEGEDNTLVHKTHFVFP